MTAIPMDGLFRKFDPATDKRRLHLAAGLVWSGAGDMRRPAVMQVER
jgi:hypothetical protein